MPRIKTESEIATMDFLRKHTNFPVPIVYHHDSNPFNRLGGEYILMSKVNDIIHLPCCHARSQRSLILSRQLEFLFPRFIIQCPTIIS